MFTVRNELMSLMDGLNEAASFHCVSRPVWVFSGTQCNQEAALMTEGRHIMTDFLHKIIIKSRLSFAATSLNKQVKTA